MTGEEDEIRHVSEEKPLGHGFSPIDMDQIRYSKTEA